jgi:hypothetical protein
MRGKGEIGLIWDLASGIEAARDEVLLRAFARYRLAAQEARPVLVAFFDRDNGTGSGHLLRVLLFETLLGE